MARPARASVPGDVWARRAVVDVVSAVCSARRRRSWVVAKGLGFRGVGGGIVSFCVEKRLLWVHDCWVYGGLMDR